MSKCLIYELSTQGFDPAFQDVASDSSGGGYNVGLVIPQTPPLVNLPKNRYLFLLAYAQFAANERAKIIGMRQLVTIGQYVPEDPQDPNSALYSLEMEVETPFWHFTDGNITWYLQRIPQVSYPIRNAANAEGLQYRYGQTPSLLFQDPPPAYVPPNGGRPYGVPLTPDLSGFHDLRFREKYSSKYFEIPIVGPCDVALYASVQQTDPATRTTLTLPEGVLPSALPNKEDQFLLNFPEAVYRRVSGSFIVEGEHCETCKISLENYKSCDCSRCNSKRKHRR